MTRFKRRLKDYFHGEKVVSSRHFVIFNVEVFFIEQVVYLKVKRNVFNW